MCVCLWITFCFIVLPLHVHRSMTTTFVGWKVVCRPCLLIGLFACNWKLSSVFACGCAILLLLFFFHIIVWWKKFNPDHFLFQINNLPSQTQSDEDSWKCRRRYTDSFCCSAFVHFQWTLKACFLHIP